MRHRARARTEGSIQSTVINWIRTKLGYRCDKLSSGSRFQKNSLPDYIVWLPAPAGKMIRGRLVRQRPSPLIIEFKKEGEELTDNQFDTADELIECGYQVIKVDSVEEGKAAVLRVIEERLKEAKQ